MAPKSCSVQEWGELKNVGLNNPPARDVECGATLILNMNRRGRCSVPLLSLDFDSIPVGKEGTFRIQFGLGYLLHASSSHHICNGQGPLTPGSFFRGGGQFRSFCDGLTTKTGGQHGGDPVNITTLTWYLLLDMPIVKDYKLRLVIWVKMIYSTRSELPGLRSVQFIKTRPPHCLSFQPETPIAPSPRHFEILNSTNVHHICESMASSNNSDTLQWLNVVQTAEEVKRTRNRLAQRKSRER